MPSAHGTATQQSACWCLLSLFIIVACVASLAILRCCGVIAACRLLPLPRLPLPPCHEHGGVQTTPFVYAMLASLARCVVSGITAFTSYRTNLSPFTKGCREWDAAM